MSKRRRVKVPQAMRLEKNGSMNFKVVRSNLNLWISISKRNVFKTIQFLGHLTALGHFMRNCDILKELPRFESLYPFCRTQPSGCISIYSSSSFCLFYLLWFSVEEMAFFIVQKNNVRKSIRKKWETKLVLVFSILTNFELDMSKYSNSNLCSSTKTKIRTLSNPLQKA